jgi:hypothetical protein
MMRNLNHEIDRKLKKLNIWKIIEKVSNLLDILEISKFKNWFLLNRKLRS